MRVSELCLRKYLYRRQYVCVCDVTVDAAMDSAAGGFNRFDMEDREQREEKMRKGRFRLGVLTLFRGLQEKTTSHGLPHVHHARGSFSYALLCTALQHKLFRQNIRDVADFKRDSVRFMDAIN